MAYIECEFRTGNLGTPSTFIAIVPEYLGDNAKTLYLLHGLTDSHRSWTRGTSIDRYAHERGMVVIMPDGGRSFYTNMKYGWNYLSYITEELVAYTRSLFRLSDKREDTFVCGNSMGGYGAFKCALTRPDIFGAAVSLSGVMDISERFDKMNEWDVDKRLIWGLDHTVKNTDADLFHLVDKLSGSETKPRLLQICGTEDFLYDANVKFRDFMKDKDFDYTYREGQGEHHWPYWDSQIGSAMDWMIGR